MTMRQQIVADLIKKFPEAGSLTLARIAYKENKPVFPTIDSARSAIRAARGINMGDGTKPLPGCERPKQSAGAGTFPKLAEGKTHFTKWEPVIIPGPLRVLILSDTHIPYHSKTAIVAALKWAKEVGVDTIILNGDTADFFSVSFWEKDPRKRGFADEVKAVKEFIETVRELFPKARLLYKKGNHEERFDRYMMVKAPELLGIEPFEVVNLLGLRADEMVEDKRPIRIGDLNVIHGHEYRFAISNPVNPARGLFLRAKAYALCGHFHQTSSHSDRTVEQRNLGTWSTGCLCDLHPDYAPLNNWNHGFAFVEVFNNNKFNVKNCFISKEGQVY